MVLDRKCAERMYNRAELGSTEAIKGTASVRALIKLAVAEVHIGMSRKLSGCKIGNDPEKGNSAERLRTSAEISQ